MGLRQDQSDFMRALGKLLAYAESLGYELTPGDTYPGKFKHKSNSWHNKGLAWDLNLFIKGHWQTSTEAHTPLGLYWESLDGTWGGRWNDGNHYSWKEVRPN